MDKQKALFLIVVVIVLSFGISIASVRASPDIAFSDGFENQNFDLWDGNGATSWLIGTYGSGSGGSADPHTGDYDAYTCENQIGDLISDDINLVGVSEATLSFWFQTDDTEPADIYLYLYDGSTYNLIGTIDTGVDDTWIYYSMDITSTYWVSNFRIDFLSSVSKSENVWIDDVLVDYVIAGQNYIADLSQSLSSTQLIVTETDYNIISSQNLATSWNIFCQWNLLADLIQSITSSWTVVLSRNMFVTLSQNINSVWQIVIKWNSYVGLTQTFSTSWMVTTQTVFNVINDLSNTFTWIVDVVHSVAGGIQHIVDLTQTISTLWIVDVYKGIKYSVNLTLFITSSWIVESSHSLFESSSGHSGISLLLIITIIFSMLLMSMRKR